MVAGTDVCVARTVTGWYGVADGCPHEGAHLSDGYLEGDEIECPLHSSVFDLRTGAVLGPPSQDPVQAYPVCVENEDVFIDVAE